MIVVHFDGLCEPKNPGGVATYGFVIQEDGKKIHEGRGLACKPFEPDATNNVAEYMGVVKALEWLIEQKKTTGPVLVRGDSQLVIKQATGEWKVKAPRIAPLNARVRELFFKFASLKFEWVPRDQNREADALTNLAYAEWKAQKK